MLLRFEHLAGLLQFGKLALLVGEFLAHLGNFLFLLADLLKDDLDRGLLDPGLAAGVDCCGWCGCMLFCVVITLLRVMGCL